jgi:hypothetical protein
MSSHQPLPAIQDLRTAFGGGVIGLGDEFADTITGSFYDIIGGVGAIVFSKEAQRDQDLFKSGYFDGASGDALTTLVQTRFGINRVLDTYGTGLALISRPNTSGGAGTIWTGTRILVASSIYSNPVEYIVSSDTPVSAAWTSFYVPVRAPVTGPVYAVNTASAQYVAKLDDIVFDSTLTVLSLVCSPGTSFEKDQDYKARVRQTRVLQRNGYIAQLIATCLGQGATNVALFPSYYAGYPNDAGLNYCYVGDSSYSGTTALSTACELALEGTRVLGPDLFVFPMTATPLSITATVYLWDSPGNFNTNLLANSISGAWVQYFTGNQNAFGFTLSGLTGAAKSAIGSIQKVVFTSPSADVAVTTTIGNKPNFPAKLPRYTLTQNSVNLTFSGPT